MQSKRAALVTGANQGVGFQVSKELVAKGLTVLVGSRNFERGEAAAKEIGQGAIALHLDGTDRPSIAAAAERIRKEFGRLDLPIAAGLNFSDGPSGRTNGDSGLWPLHINYSRRFASRKDFPTSGVPQCRVRLLPPRRARP